MCLKFVLVASLSLVVVLGEPPVPQYGPPQANSYNTNNGYSNGGYSADSQSDYNGNNHGASLDTYGAPNHDAHNEHDHGGYGEPKAYEFGYQVKDDYTGTNYNRQEQSDGNQVTGSYRVALPDGRTQIVTYYADWKTGFHADVRYEGEAHYPETHSNNNNNGYNYNNNNNNNIATGYNSNAQSINNQYGPPINPVAINNQYAPPSTNYGQPAISSVSIKDFSSSSNAYNNNNNNYDSGYNYNNNNNNNNYNNYDSYADSGYANKPKPSSSYGAP